MWQMARMPEMQLLQEMARTGPPEIRPKSMETRQIAGKYILILIHKTQITDRQCCRQTERWQEVVPPTRGSTWSPPTTPTTPPWTLTSPGRCSLTNLDNKWNKNVIWRQSMQLQLYKCHNCLIWSKELLHLNWKKLSQPLKSRLKMRGKELTKKRRIWTELIPIEEDM